MRFVAAGLLALVAVVGCNKVKKITEATGGGGAAAPAETPDDAPAKAPPRATAATLAEARKGFVTKLPRAGAADNDPPPAPPRGLFKLVRYDSPAGKLAAYVTPEPKGGGKRPAIVWITGGDCNSIGSMWGPSNPKNDQSAAQYREAGVVLMVASLRGGNDNPGRREFFLGEVDDVVAAADYMRTLPYVDPARVYLGGHSTGGTVALLAAECSDAFRAVFAFGPVDDPTGYGTELAGFNTRDPKEVEVRSPGKWLGSVASPTFVIEGATQGNADCLARMARGNTNPKVSFLTVRGGDHFSILAPLNRMVAGKILADTGPACGITLTAGECEAAVRR